MGCALAQTPMPAPMPTHPAVVDQVDRLHREADRLQRDARIKIEIDQAVRDGLSIARDAQMAIKAMPMDMAFQWEAKRYNGNGQNAYRRGLSSLDERKWEDAIEYFKRTDKYRPDAALYWTAFAQFKAGQSAQALASLASLDKEHSASPWRNDAKTLEVEIKSAQGKPVNPDTVGDDELKLIAVSGLIRSDVDKALPYLEKLVSSSQSPRVKEEALSMLARTGSPKAREVVVKVARSGNPDAQLKAIRALGHMESKEGPSMLATIYGDAKDREVKEEVLDALGNARAAKQVMDIAKAEKDFDLKKRAVRHLSRMNTKESNDYLMDMLK
ncbi:MAG: HEAT repeat domain-containing protein [Verrucomicrobiota bacterium]